MEKITEIVVLKRVGSNAPMFVRADVYEKFKHRYTGYVIVTDTAEIDRLASRHYRPVDAATVAIPEPDDVQGPDDTGVEDISETPDEVDFPNEEDDAAVLEVKTKTKIPKKKKGPPKV